MSPSPVKLPYTTIEKDSVPLGPDGVTTLVGSTDTLTHKTLAHKTLTLDTVKTPWVKPVSNCLNCQQDLSRVSITMGCHSCVLCQYWFLDLDHFMLSAARFDEIHAL